MTEGASKILKWLVLFIIPLLIYIASLPAIPLIEPDEGRYSLIPQEMIQTGDYVTPRLKGVDYFEKPVLDYWATAVSFKIFGENAFASRLFVALCAWGCIMLAYRIGRRFHDEKTGIFAAALLSTTIYHFVMGRAHVLDMPLTFFVSMGIWSCYRFFEDERRKRIWLYLAYFFAGLAFLSKGLIGVVFPFTIAFFWLVFRKRFRDIFRLISPAGLIILLLVTGPWLYLVQKANPDFFNFFFIHEHLQRFTTKIHNRYEPFWFFIPVLIGGFIPWLGYLPQAIKYMRPRIGFIFKKDETAFLLTWAGFVFLFFSASSSKLVPYIAPVFIPLSVMLGHIFRQGDDALRQGSHVTTGIIASSAVWLQSAAIGTGIVFLPLFDKGSLISMSRWLPYVIVPVIMLLCLTFLPSMVRKRLRQGWFFSIYIFSAVFFLSLLVPAAKYVTPYKSALPIVEAIREHVPEGSVPVQFKMSNYGIDFYTRMKTPVVDDYGELDYGVAKLSNEEKIRRFPSSRDFFEQYKKSGEEWCVTDDIYKVDILKEKSPAAEVLWQNREYFLIHMKKGTSIGGKP
ncbi:MAG TPA: glycosyltransferase family 39 protein [Desulfomonilia bacterium]